MDVSYQDPKDGMSALMKAADGGHVQAVEMLLLAGCPWNLQDHEGYTAGVCRMHCQSTLWHSLSLQESTGCTNLPS